MLKIQFIYKFLSRLSKREKLILYVTSFVIAIMLLDRLVVQPIFTKIKDLNEEIASKESGIQDNLHILTHKDRITAESVKYASFFKGPTAEEEVISFLLKEIADMATKASVYLVDIKPGAAKSSEGVTNTYSVNLNCEAQMQQLVEFMFNIENSSSLLSIEKYRIGPKSKETSVATCSMSVSKIIIPLEKR